MNAIKINIGFWIDVLATGLMSVVCLGYSVYSSNLAEWHITVPFLDFPIFIGEILFSIIGLLFLIKWAAGYIFWRPWYFAVFVYFFWVLIFAAFGYVQWGPLALRNAALFYYPIFIFFGYIFYNSKLFSIPVRIVGVVLLLVLMITNTVGGDFRWIFVALYFSLSWRIEPRWLKNTLTGLLIFSKPHLLFVGSRSSLIGFLAAAIFLDILVLKRYLKRHLVLSTLITIFLIIVASLAAALVWGDKNNTRSLIHPLGLIAYYKDEQHNKDVRIKSYVPGPLTVHIYNPNQKVSNSPNHQIVNKDKTSVIPPVSKEIVNKDKTSVMPSVSKELSDVPRIDIVNRLDKRSLDESEASDQPRGSPNVLVDSPPEGRALGTAYGNVLFRLFIWEDMCWDLWDQKALFGFGFGKPIRSISIEALNWASGEWQRDGWIAPHNSYLHIIYRTGLVGMLLIGFVFYFFVFLVKKFWAHKDWAGFFLLSAVIYWFAMASFLLIFELPYYAIPMWTILGLAFGYAQKHKTDSIIK